MELFYTAVLYFSEIHGGKAVLLDVSCGRIGVVNVTLAPLFYRCPGSLKPEQKGEKYAPNTRDPS